VVASSGGISSNHAIAQRDPQDMTIIYPGRRPPRNDVDRAAALDRGARARHSLGSEGGEPMKDAVIVSASFVRVTSRVPAARR
jgi:hypothetical protein